MKNVDLIEVTLEDLQGVSPSPSTEIVFQNVRYRILEVRPPKEKSRRWRPGQPKAVKPKWQLLVRKLDESAHG
jgi:hypothetical protein